MCLETEEWRTIQVIQPRLLEAIQHTIEKRSASEAVPHASLHEFLRYELQKLVISVPTGRDIDQEATYHFTKEIVELFKKIYPVLLRILPNDPSLLYIQSLLGLQALGDKREMKLAEAGSGSLGALSLSDAKSLLEALTCFNRRIESIFWTHLREATPGVESSKLSGMVLNETKRALIDALLASLEPHMACCKRQDQHHMLLQGAGRNWHAEMNSLISLLLSSCRDPSGWQEIECLSDKSLSRDKQKKGKLKPLQSLCQDIAVAQSYNDVLPLILSEGALYKQPREQQRAQRRAMVQVTTLKELIERQRFSPMRTCSLSSTNFTIPEKRELSLNVAWCFLYLFNCSWTDNSWSADTVSLLLSASASSGSLQFETPPYIRCDPKCGPSEKNDGLGIMMNDSVFLTLGQLLVEIELGRRITPTECNRHGQPSLWLTLDKILREDGMFSACDDYLKAIEGCLELHRSIVELSPEERAAESAKLIYDAIVVNLEKDFDHYRKPSQKRKRGVSPPLRDLKLDAPPPTDVLIAQMAKSRDREVDAEYEHGLGASAAPSKCSNGYDDKICSDIQLEATIVDADQGFKQTLKRPRIASQPSIARRTMVARSSLHADPNRITTFSSVSPGFVQIFDDLEPDTASADARAVSLSRKFFVKMQCYLDSYPPSVNTSHKGSKRVKVCIIDTGFDETHPALQAAKLMKRIVAMKNFKGDAFNLDDEIGHGTHMAELIQTLAPNAELCIAKVAVANAMPQEDTKLIIEAIHWAMAQGVDIISLSLGLDVLDSTLDIAINKAVAEGIIIVAAAGNDGNNKPRAYPGSNRNVLCIHASDGKGKDGGISPRAWDNDDNFMTLGTAVPLFWKGEEVVKFGTSFATAVAAAIAADALAIIPQMVSLTAEQLSRLYSSSGMRSIFDLFSVPDNGYRYIAPWNLWDGSRSSMLIQEMISDALKR